MGILPSTPFEAARELISLGHYVVPIPTRSKAPVLREWQKLRLSPQDLPQYFSNGSNVGLLNGVAPHFIADVDIDWPEAVVTARSICGPATDRVCGHASNPDSHYFYEIGESFSPKKFSAPGDGKPVLELRGPGMQTVIPPSLHEGTDEQIEWRCAGAFGKTTQVELVCWCAKVSAAALLARYWPSEGLRHDGVFALAGMLHRAGWTEDTAIEFIGAAAQAAGDKYQKRTRDVRQTFRRGDAGKPATGIPTAVDLFGAEIISTVRAWLSLVDSPQPSITDVVDVSIQTVTAASIEPESIQWLWPNRIPLGKLTVFCGAPDVGKSAISIDIIARGTTGKEWPDCENEHAPFDVLMLVAEDDLEDTTVPRLIASGADLNRVHFVLKTVVAFKAKREERQFALDTDLVALADRLAKNPEIKMVILDPLGSYLGKFKKNDEESIRWVLTEIKELAAKAGVAVLSIDHFNKNFAQAAIHRLSGAGALVAVPRAVWGFVKDDGDEQQLDRLMLNVKLNVASEAKKAGLKYRFSEVQLTIHDKIVGLPAVDWRGKTENTLDDVLHAQTDVKEKRGAKAARFLKKLLAGGAMHSVQIEKEAAAARISHNALWEAKSELNIKPTKTPSGSWWWELPGESGE